METLVILALSTTFSALICFFCRRMWQEVGYHKGYREGYKMARDSLAAGYRYLTLIRGGK